MALSAAIIWEVRSGGNANNGGGYKAGASGTDYSQQNAAQYSLTGVTSSGAGATVLTASASADMVGNIGNITAGTNFTAGRREIISVVVGVSITFDAAVTTGVGSAGAITIGGAVTLPTTIAASITGGHTVYFKSGTAYTVTAGSTITGSGDPEMRFEGYTTTRGDFGRATITTATNSVNLFTIQTIVTCVFRALIFTNTAVTRGVGLQMNTTSGSKVIIRDCLFDGCSNGLSDANGSGVAWFLLHVEIKNSSGSGIAVTKITSIHAWACWFHNNTAHAFTSSNNNQKVYNFSRCIFSDNGTDGYNEATPNTNVVAMFTHCVFANNTGSGIKETDTTKATHLTLINCIFYGNSGWGINWQTTLAPAYFVGICNAFGSNTLGNYTSVVPAGAGDVALSANPFTSSTDFSLNSTAGGGTALKNVGDPVSIP